jgi:hypothetical protein
MRGIAPLAVYSSLIRASEVIIDTGSSAVIVDESIGMALRRVIIPLPFICEIVE